MPRRPCKKIISHEPKFTFFKPVGIPLKDLDEIVISVEEFEAIRLKFVENKSQEEASKEMNISQPTFHRLINQAQQKIALALVNGCVIKIEGGNFEFAVGMKRCRHRGHHFSD